MTTKTKTKSEPQTLEQWLDVNAPEWVSDAYRKQTQAILERLQTAESSMMHPGDKVVEVEAKSGPQAVYEKDHFPVPDAVLDDPNATEILRIWKQGDESLSHIAATYQLDGPAAWGRCFGNVAASIIAASEETEGESYDEDTMKGAVARAFLESLGVSLSVIMVQGDCKDPDCPIHSKPNTEKLLN